MVTVLSNADLLKHLETGETPVPPEVAADNARTRPKPVEIKKDAPKEAVKEAPKEEPEDEDGLTAADREAMTAKMLKAIGKKTAQLRDAEDFAEHQYNQAVLANRRAENAERQLAELRAQHAPKLEPPKKPERPAFETDEAYQDALVEYRVKEQLAKERVQQAEKEAQERQQNILKQASQRIAKAIELVPDYQEITEAAEMTVPPYIAGYMQESELFAELGYHFAKHPEVLEKLTQLSPAKALVEVGKIESTLQPFASQESFKETKAKETESAPKSADPSPQTESSRPAADPSPQSRAPVITPLNTSSAGQVEKAPQQMNTREMIASWSRQNKVDFGRRKRH